MDHNSHDIDFAIRFWHYFQIFFINI